MKRTCPECNQVSSFSLVTDQKNTDILGREQYECFNCRSYCVLIDEDMVHSSEKLEWNNNLLQFARLLEEIAAAGLPPSVKENIMRSSGLNEQQLAELFERASLVFEQAKEINFQPSIAEWEVSADPAPMKSGVLTWNVINRDQTKKVQLPVLPFQIGPRIASMIALALNSEPKTMTTDADPKAQTT